MERYAAGLLRPRGTVPVRGTTSAVAGRAGRSPETVASSDNRTLEHAVGPCALTQICFRPKALTRSSCGLGCRLVERALLLSQSDHPRRKGSMWTTTSELAAEVAAADVEREAI